MFNFLHNNIPSPILISFGPVNIFYYGLFIVIGILLGIFICLKLADTYNIKKELIIDASFWLILGGILGGRIYHIFLEWSYYFENPENIIKIWQGGLAIHGGIIAGLIIIYFFARKNEINLWLLTSIYAPALALGQSIGRWGNYFNQELFGKPTDLPWGIPILPQNRINEYYNYQYFHPTFIYESIGNFVIFVLLIACHHFINKEQKNKYKIITSVYLILYSFLRFSMEFIRIDSTAIVAGIRFPQIASIIIIFSVIAYWTLEKRKKLKEIVKTTEKGEFIDNISS